MLSFLKETKLLLSFRRLLSSAEVPIFRSDRGKIQCQIKSDSCVGLKLFSFFAKTRTQYFQKSVSIRPDRESPPQSLWFFLSRTRKLFFPRSDFKPTLFLFPVCHPRLAVDRVCRRKSPDKYFFLLSIFLNKGGGEKNFLLRRKLFPRG